MMMGSTVIAIENGDIGTVVECDEGDYDTCVRFRNGVKVWMNSTHLYEITE